jgi:hypothetical protein
MRLLVIIRSDFLSVTRKQFARQRALVKLIEGPEDVKTAEELDREAAAAFDIASPLEIPVPYCGLPVYSMLRR